MKQNKYPIAEKLNNKLVLDPVIDVIIGDIPTMLSLNIQANK